MKTYIVRYNMKSSTFHRFSKDSIPTKNEVITSADYITLGTIKAEDLDDAYRILNINHPENIIDSIRKLHDEDPRHTKYESLHSSLSIGDVLIDVQDNKYYFCDNIGWEELV